MILVPRAALRELVELAHSIHDPVVRLQGTNDAINLEPEALKQWLKGKVADTRDKAFKEFQAIVHHLAPDIL